MSDLTHTRLRTLIAAATPGTFYQVNGDIFANESGDCIAQMVGHEWQPNSVAITYILNNASALADALEAKELLEWAIANCYIAAPIARENGKQIDAAEVETIDALRAAKEAADGK